MTRNKEAVLSEKDFSCHFGQTVLCGYTQPIKPADFDTFQKFVDELQRVWDSEWRRVYSSSYTGITFERQNRLASMQQNIPNATGNVFIHISAQKCSSCKCPGLSYFWCLLS